MGRYRMQALSDVDFPHGARAKQTGRSKQCVADTGFPERRRADDRPRNCVLPLSGRMEKQMEFTLQPQQQQYSTKSLVSIGVTVLLHLIIGYALITGLARDMISVITKPIETRIIEEVKPPPPPPEVKPEPPKARIKPPPAYVPPPEVRVATPPPENVIAAVSNTPPPPAVEPVPATPPAPPIAKVGLACPNSGQIRSSLEYPRQALKDNVTGNVVVQFVVGTNGQTRDFSLISAAHPLLNRAALEAAQRFGCVGQGREVVVQVPFNFKLE
jgi:protein TonB